MLKSVAGYREMEEKNPEIDRFLEQAETWREAMETRAPWSPMPR